MQGLVDPIDGLIGKVSISAASHLHSSVGDVE
jgi:hypothetical protein